MRYLVLFSRAHDFVQSVRAAEDRYGGSIPQRVAVELAAVGASIAQQLGSPSWVEAKAVQREVTEEVARLLQAYAPQPSRV